MKLLTKISNITFIIIAIVLVLTAIMLYFLLNWKIEVAIKANLSTYGMTKQVVMINPSDVYKIEIGDTITINLNGQYYSTRIKNIDFNDVKKMFALELHEMDIKLIPDSVVPVSIIYEYHKVLAQLFGSV